MPALITADGTRIAARSLHPARPILVPPASGFLLFDMSGVFTVDDLRRVLLDHDGGARPRNDVMVEGTPDASPAVALACPDDEARASSPTASDIAALVVATHTLIDEIRATRKPMAATPRDAVARTTITPTKQDIIAVSRKLHRVGLLK